MKRFVLTLIVLIVICATFFVALSMPRGMGNERAIAGVLDLTHADFTQTRHNLEGEWEFFFDALYTPEDFANGTIAEGTFIEVPGSWHESGFPRNGFATYRLIIKTDEPSLMILLPQITSASIVWLNGVKVSEEGVISTNPPMEEHGASNIFIPFSPVNGQIEIIVNAANFTWFTAGLRKNIEMGTPENLIRDAVFRRVVLALFIGMLIAMILYHVLLFIYYRNEWVYLAFAVFCLLTAVKFIWETDGLLHLFWGRGVIIRDLLQVVTIMAGASLAVFTHLALRIPISKIRGIAYGALFGIPSLMVLLLPAQVLDRRFVFVAVLAAPILFVSILRSTNLKGNYKHLLLITVAVFFIGQPLNRLFFDEHTFYMFLAIPHLFVILSHFLLLWVNFSEEKRAGREAREINKLLARLNRLKTNFLADISHEMKMPLTIMGGFAELTQLQIDEGTVNESTRENLSIISDEAQRLAQLVDRLLDVSAAKEGATGRVRVLVPDIMSRATALCNPILAANGNRLDIQIEKDCPYIMANPDVLIQILFNLTNNANRHTKDSMITITACTMGDMVQFQVRDTGTGIPVNMMDKIFERGVSGDGSTGLGLVICKDAVEVHGGTINIKSEQGKGTTVSFTLPIYNETEGVLYEPDYTVG